MLYNISIGAPFYFLSVHAFLTGGVYYKFMRRRKNKNKLWIILGGVVFVVAIIIGVKDISWSKSPASIVQSAPATSTAPLMLSTTFGKISIQGNTVVARGRNYELSPINMLATPGFFAVEGKIVQIIPDPTTKSQTPYYFVIQGGGNLALVGIVVPVGDGTGFNVSAFPIGSNILVAGTVFPSVDPTAAVFDYSQLLQELHVAPGLPQLNLPTSTPFIGANFKDMAVTS